MSDIRYNPALRERISQHPVYVELEAKIRQERLTEALQKNISKKAILVAKHMGFQIRLASGTNLDSITPISTPFNSYSYDDDYDENAIEESDIGSEFGGWSFDALSWGCNLQIMVYAHQDDRTGRVMITRHIVSFDGVVVYEEDSGDMLIYLPSANWESRIEHWAKGAETVKKNKEKAEKKETTNSAATLLQNIQTLLKITWGI